MSVQTVVSCDLCGLGSAGDRFADPVQLACDEGLILGSDAGLPDLPHVHLSCADEHKRTGTPGGLLAGVPGLCEVGPEPVDRGGW